MKPIVYKAYRSIIPCLLLTLSIGFCYAFSLFTPHIAEAIGVSRTAAQFTFCLNIFFLGMGAAFFGGLVERNIKLAAVLSTVLLFFGFVLGGVAVYLKNIWLMYVGLGLCAGISEGTGYVVPVKNNILWIRNKKHLGLIAAISIVSFGLGSTICSYLFRAFFPVYGISGIFFVLGIFYLVPTAISCLMINKPKYATSKRRNAKKASLIEWGVLKDSFFWKMWTFMFLNISMGLVLIGSCASILGELNLSPGLVITVMMLCGIFNGGGRLVFPAAADFLKDRMNILYITLLIEVLMIGTSAVWYAFIPIAIIVINSCYGSGFSNLPSILHAHYGIERLSAIHGLVLSSWGFASLFAYLCTTLITQYCSGGYYFLTVVLCAFYVVNLLVVWSAKRGN